MKREAHPEASVEELIARARLDDKGALEELFRRCRPRLDDLAAQRLAKKQPDITRPSDIAQETALRAFRRFSTFKGATEREWMSWMTSILETTATQSYRDAGRQKRDIHRTVPLDTPETAEVPGSERSPSQAAAFNEECRRTFTHIFQLPDEQRQAIWHCLLEGLPLAEAARRMGKTEAAVVGLVQRGRKALRLRMTEGADGTPPDVRAPTASEDAALALLGYWRRLDAGERVDPAAFVSEHPSCADELRDLLEWIGRLEALRPARIEE